MRRAVLFSVAAAAACAQAAAETPYAVAVFPDPVVAVAPSGEPRTPVAVRTADGRVWRVALDDELYAASAARFPTENETPDSAIPLSHAATGGVGITRAWLAEPTERHAHGVLGDAIEAGALMAEDESGEIHVARLSEQEVFEDVRPRFADLDGDGDDEILVVRSSLDRGASLAAFDVTEGRLEQVAQTPYLGQPNRWLNPIGAADFDGDGAVEVALVATPHIGGVLSFYEFDGDRFIPELEAPGFSNHALGSPVVDLAAVMDVNGDGVPDLIVPNAERDALRVVTLAGGRFQELGAIPLAEARDAVAIVGDRAPFLVDPSIAHVAGPMVAADGIVAATLDNGTLFLTRPAAALASPPRE